MMTWSNKHWINNKHWSAITQSRPFKKKGKRGDVISHDQVCFSTVNPPPVLCCLPSDYKINRSHVACLAHPWHPSMTVLCTARHWCTQVSSSVSSTCLTCLWTVGRSKKRQRLGFKPWAEAMLTSELEGIKSLLLTATSGYTLKACPGDGEQVKGLLCRVPSLCLTSRDGCKSSERDTHGKKQLIHIC